jgi:hypothetical protein
VHKPKYRLKEIRIPRNISELGSLYIDLGAERVIAAERANEKIAVEVKGFLGSSAVTSIKFSDLSTRR